ncbi:MAG: hypothetical protein IT371_06105 [Deltaproteobacteria bacterium]|nr:hypothetical protein [Deltaproteobacteria bacterium]
MSTGRKGRTKRKPRPRKPSPARQGTPLRRGLRPESSLLPLVENGLGALADRDCLETSIRADFKDSLDLDAALRADHPEEPRWDYLLGHGPSGKVVALEAHSAREDQVSAVIAKKEAARVQLRGHLKDGARVAAWLWVASGSVEFLRMEAIRFRLDQKGILFVGREVLSKHLGVGPSGTSTRAE